jgi:hypothetical protein
MPAHDSFCKSRKGPLVVRKVSSVSLEYTIAAMLPLLGRKRIAPFHPTNISSGRWTSSCVPSGNILCKSSPVRDHREPRPKHAAASRNFAHHAAAIQVMARSSNHAFTLCFSCPYIQAHANPFRLHVCIREHEKRGFVISHVIV